MNEGRAALHLHGVRGVRTALVRTQRRSRRMHEPSPNEFLRLNIQLVSEGKSLFESWAAIHRVSDNLPYSSG